MALVFFLCVPRWRDPQSPTHSGSQWLTLVIFFVVCPLTKISPSYCFSGADFTPAILYFSTAVFDPFPLPKYPQPLIHV